MKKSRKQGEERLISHGEFLGLGRRTYNDQKPPATTMNRNMINLRQVTKLRKLAWREYNTTA